MKRIAPAILFLAFACAVFAPSVSIRGNDGKISYHSFSKKHSHFEKAVTNVNGYHYSVQPVKSTGPVYFSFPHRTSSFYYAAPGNATVFIQPIPLYLLHAVYRV